jgi:hypothetical protein
LGGDKKDPAQERRTMSNFTQGPWNEVTHSWSDIGVYSDKKRIAMLSIADEATEDTEHDLHYEMFANAQLISAAPDLLEALESLFNAVDSCTELTPDVMRKAQSAIKKARGES